MIEFVHEKQEQGAGRKVWEKARVVSLRLTPPVSTSIQSP